MSDDSVMKKFSAWIQVARLPTLLLSISGILVGSASALDSSDYSWVVFNLVLLTAVCFQIISNLANDYGDYKSGVDNSNRRGQKRALQRGLLNTEELKKGIKFLILISAILVVLWVSLAFGLNDWIYALAFLVLMALAIVAALKYTLGNNPYGYKGYGDLSVFLFFGVFSVLGSRFVQVQTITIENICWAIIIGLLSVAVLNLNNIRDVENDSKYGKRTLAVKLGVSKAIVYQYGLVGTAISIIVYLVALDRPHDVISLAFGLLIFLVLMDTFRIPNGIKNGKMDVRLRRVSIYTFLISSVYFINSLTDIV